MDWLDKFFVIGIICWIIVVYFWISSVIKRSRRKGCIHYDTPESLARDITNGHYGSDPEWLDNVQDEYKRWMEKDD